MNSNPNNGLKKIAHPLIGYGEAFASFGEIVQGRLRNGDDFLITLPVNMWSTCEVTCHPISGPSEVNCTYWKSRIVAEKILEQLNHVFGYKLTIKFTRDIPIGKGLSSSTADMLAVVRALQEIFGVIVTETFISRLFSSIEPHDALHYYMSVAYNHREGVLLRKMYYIPQYLIIALDSGGVVDTESYNKSLSFSPEDLISFDELYFGICNEFDKRNDQEIARYASRATKLHSERSGREILKTVLDLADQCNALGVITAHSGTCVGLLYPKNIDSSQVQKIQEIVSSETGMSSFYTKTLEILY